MKKILMVFLLALGIATAQAGWWNVRVGDDGKLEFDTLISKNGIATQSWAHTEFYDKAFLDSNFLTAAQIEASYVKTASANAKYLSITTASSTYLTKSDAAGIYASATALTALQTSLSSYVMQNSLTSTLSAYSTTAQISAAYLTSATATSTYLKKTDAASTYLTSALAASTYLSQSSATSTYLKKTDAAATYVAKADAPRYYRIKIDCTPRIAYSGSTKIDFFPTDFELKNGLGDAYSYGAATFFPRDPEDPHRPSPKRDMEANIWFQCADLVNFHASSWVPFEPKVFTSLAQQVRLMSATTTMAAPTNTEITAMAIEPNIDGELLNGTRVSGVWSDSNASLNPMAILYNTASVELSSKGNERWRSAEIERIYQRTSKPQGYAVILDNYQFQSWTSGVPTNWTKGIYVTSCSQITNDLPVGYTSGIRLVTSYALGGSTSNNMLSMPSPAVAYKSYHAIVGCWARRIPGNTNGSTSMGISYGNAMCVLKENGMLGGVALTNTWVYYVGYGKITTNASLKLGITGHSTGAEITGLTFIIWEAE